MLPHYDMKVNNILSINADNHLTPREGAGLWHRERKAAQDETER
jgi:hypothetical protein